MRSRVCAVVDVIAVTAGVAEIMIVAVDNVVTWPANRVLIAPDLQAGVALAIVVPFGLWIFVALVQVFNMKNGGRTDRRAHAAARRAHSRTIRRVVPYPRWARPGLALAGIICLVAIFGGIAVGAAKGTARVMPGPRYEVSTIELNNSEWTPVTADQYALWQARFVRADGLLTLFGLFLVGGSFQLIHLHRTTRPMRDSGSFL